MSLKYKWILPKADNETSDKVESLSSSLNLNPGIIRLLINRGYKSESSIKDFLQPTLDKLNDPMSMHDMKQALDIIHRTIQNHEKITVYGDYDVDGITSTSIMYSMLKAIGADVVPFIPNRFKDGYGPNLAEYERIVDHGTKLIITVDNGIMGKKEVRWVEQHGCRVIITDHHDFPDNKEDIPAADAIVMAKYPGHQYNPDSQGQSKEDYCGAGIAFKMAQAEHTAHPDEFTEQQWLGLIDLACLGTVADSVSLTSEDRVIVANGLNAIHHDKRIGIQTLARVSGIDLDTLKSTDLSFSLIPRLNSLGRMDDANKGVELLTTCDEQQAAKIAKYTEKCNRKRQHMMNEEVGSALEQAATPENRKRCTLVLANKGWFPGIVGIIASHVLDQYYKPTIVIGHLPADDKKGIDRGSGRSIPEFNLFRAMQPIHDYMVSFGGHPMACGLSIQPQKIDSLRSGLERAGRAAGLSQVVPKVQPDLMLSVGDINIQTMQSISQLEPFGVDNPSPLIAVKVPKVYNIKQAGNNTLMFTLGPDFSSIHCVGFHMGDKYQSLQTDPANVILAGSMNLNHYKGYVNVQMFVRHVGHYQSQDKLSRADFVKVYRYVRRQAQPVSVKNIAQGVSMNATLIELAVQVFTELNLFNQQAGDDGPVYSCVPHPEPTSLDKSATYQDEVPRMEIEDI